MEVIERRVMGECHMKILVADDHAIVRRGLRTVIGDDLPDAFIGEACTGRDAIERIRAESWDAVVLDLNLPDRNGLEILKLLKNEYPALPIIVLSFYPDEQYAMRALKAGAAAYLNKETAPNELVHAISTAIRGQEYVRPTQAHQLVHGLRSQHRGTLHDVLSDRELEVLCSIANGKTIPEIAEILSLSVKTVSTYRSRIQAKLQIKSTAALIRYAIDQGFAG